VYCTDCVCRSSDGPALTDGQATGQPGHLYEGGAQQPTSRHIVTWRCAMKSWFSWVPMTLFLAVIWMLLAHTPLSTATLVFAFVASLIIVLMSRRLRPFLARPKRIWVILKLTCVVLADTF